MKFISGSWKRQQGTEDGFVNYRELARQLVQYVQEMGMQCGVTAGHGASIRRVLGLSGDFVLCTDFPSWFAGGFYVSLWMTMHQASRIGVILDWVPAHFPKDETWTRRGLTELACMSMRIRETGMSIRIGGHLIYNYGRPEVAELS